MDKFMHAKNSHQKASLNGTSVTVTEPMDHEQETNETETETSMQHGWFKMAGSK